MELNVRWYSRPFFIQIVSTLSFSVLYSTLVLYFQGKLGLSAHSANSIMGVFIAFNYGLHLLGGFWGGVFYPTVPYSVWECWPR